MSFKMDVFKNLAIFTGKHLPWSLFVRKLTACKPANLLKRDLFIDNTGVSYEYCKIFKNNFVYRRPSVAAI